HHQVDVQAVPAKLAAGLVCAVTLRLAERRADVADPGPDAAGAFFAVAELWNLDRRQRDADEVLALLADHLAAADVLRQVRLHFAADELVESLVVTLDLLTHGNSPA